ncbi:MAG: hypothetical protein IJ060_02055 [Oscillospiraceae bacterium]|nr:hypothetical protein [Oscillospiraceae bacterium]
MKTKTMLKVTSALVAVIISSNVLPLQSFAKIAIIAESIDVSPVVDAQAEEETSSPKWGDVNADGSIDDTDAKAVLTTKYTDSPQADVNADGALDQTDADMISSFISGEIGYFPVGTYYSADTTYVTRGEWIHALVTGFSMSAADDSEIVEYYTDLADYQYGAEITLAANFGVFDVLGAEFHPDAFVTRDFAAHTMNFCLGYPNDVSITYKDADAVYYDGDAQIALNRGWFKAENSEFRPSMYVTSDENSHIIADMQTALSASVIDEEHENTVVYADNVIQITDADSIVLEDDTVTITGSSVSLNEGDVFTFVQDGIDIICKVTSVTGIGDDSITVAVEDADSIDCGANPLNIVTKNGILEFGTVTCSDFNVKGDCTVSGNTKFKCNSMNFDGDVVYCDGTLDVSRKPLTVNGSLKMESNIDLNGGSITADNLTMDGYSTLKLNKGQISISGNVTVNESTFDMQNSKDSITIGGDLLIPRNSGSGHTDNITAGTISCAGDVLLTGTEPLRTSGTFTFISNGESDAEIHVNNCFNGEWSTDYYVFSNFKIMNAGSRTITLRQHRIYSDQEKTHPAQKLKTQRYVHFKSAGRTESSRQGFPVSQIQICQCEHDIQFGGLFSQTPISSFLISE